MRQRASGALRWMRPHEPRIEALLIASEQQGAEPYKRLPGGWTTEVVQDKVTLPCLNIALNLSDIYAGVSLEARWGRGWGRLETKRRKFHLSSSPSFQS